MKFSRIPSAPFFIAKTTRHTNGGKTWKSMPTRSKNELLVTTKICFFQMELQSLSLMMKFFYIKRFFTLQVDDIRGDIRIWIRDISHWPKKCHFQKTSGSPITSKAESTGLSWVLSSAQISRIFSATFKEIHINFFNHFVQILY